MFNRKVKELLEKIEDLASAVEELKDKLWQHENPYGTVISNSLIVSEEILYNPTRGKKIILNYYSIFREKFAGYRLKKVGATTYIMVQMISDPDGKVYDKWFAYDSVADACIRLSHTPEFDGFDVDAIAKNTKKESVKDAD